MGGVTVDTHRKTDLFINFLFLYNFLGHVSLINLFPLSFQVLILSSYEFHKYWTIFGLPLCCSVVTTVTEVGSLDAIELPTLRNTLRAF